MSLSAAPPPRLPRHIAIIMDGNGRWAQARGLPRIAGHRQGADAVRRTLIAAGELGIPYLTLFGFSSENWKRPQDEIESLMGLLRHYLRSEIAELHRNGVRLRIIGERDRLAGDIAAMIRNAEILTRDNDRMNLTIALSYGGRAEIVAAARAIAAEVMTGKLALDHIDEAADRQTPVHVGAAGARSVDPHQRRTAHQQFSFMAVRLRRARFHEDIVARFRPGRPRTGGR